MGDSIGGRAADEPAALAQLSRRPLRRHPTCADSTRAH